MTDPKHDFDLHTCEIGSILDDTDRIPRVSVTMSRTTNLIGRDAGNPGWQLANLSLTTGGMDTALVGLSIEDIRTLIQFLADYEQRMRNY